MGSRARWNIAREVRTAVSVRNAFKPSHRDDQPEYDQRARGIERDRLDKPPPPAPRPGASHYNSAPATYHHGAQALSGPPGQQWPPAPAPQDPSPSYQGTLQSSGQSMYPPPHNAYPVPGQQPQYQQQQENNGTLQSSGQSMYPPPHNAYPVPGQQPPYQQQQGNNPLHYQNTNQYGQSSPPRPGPDSGYPVNPYPGYPHTDMNSSAQNLDPQSNYYDSNSHGQGQTYPSDPRTFGAATAPPASQYPHGQPPGAADYGGTNYPGSSDEQQSFHSGHDYNPWRNEQSYNRGPDYNGGSNVQGRYR